MDPDNGFRPAGQFNVSSTTYTNAELFVDYGSNVQAGSTATHKMSLYRAPSGALVFGAGTVQWSWGLDDPGSTPDTTMRQATVNLFADMGVQPYALGYPGLTAATKSTDASPPTSSITSPANGTSVGDGTAMTISGTAADSGGGIVAGVEVSTDGGTTWRPATGTTSWSYSWVAHGNPSTTIRTRAVDDSGNIESPSAGRQLNVGCTCSIWGTASAPTLSDSGSATAVEVGVKFRSDVSGKVTGVRFYKNSRNTGTHVGNLWTASGTKLATVTFSNETTSGWQQATFSTPVSINANTTYVVSYFAPNGHTAQDENYLFPNPSPRPDTRSHVDSPPLHALRNTNGVVNGLFRNGSSSGFPTNSHDASNYWVDVMFTLNTGPADRARHADGCPGHARQRVRGGDLVGTTRRWDCDHRLHRTPYIGVDSRSRPKTRHRQPAGHEHDRGRADQRCRVHVQGGGDQRGRHESRLRGVQRRHPGGRELLRVHPVAVVDRSVHPRPVRPELQRGRREVQGGPQRRDQGDPVLQGRRQHRHAHREPVDAVRDEAGDGDVRQRDRLRVATGPVLDTGAHHGGYDLRGLVLRAERPLRR